MAAAMKKLYRSTDDKVIGGVCGGIAEYLNADPTSIRVLWALATLLTGIIFGLLAYVVALFIIPEKTPDTFKESKSSKQYKPPAGKPASVLSEE